MADYTTKAYTAADIKAMQDARVANLAAKGRAWLRVEGAKARRALAAYGQMGQYEDGSRGCLESNLEELRAAWPLAR